VAQGVGPEFKLQHQKKKKKHLFHCREGGVVPLDQELGNSLGQVGRGLGRFRKGEGDARQNAGPYRLRSVMQKRNIAPSICGKPEIAGYIAGYSLLVL
jgi:hypothetical protein